MNDRYREASIAELLVRASVYAETFGKPLRNMIEGYGYIVRYMALLSVDVRGNDVENACKQVLKISGSCDKFLKAFATDVITNNLILDSELPEEAPDDL